MKYNLKIDEQARKDLQNSSQYYKEILTPLSEKFKLELRKEFKQIKRNPLVFQERYKGVRIAFLKKFPFGVHFKVFDNQIEVIKILHTKQNLK